MSFVTPFTGDLKEGSYSVNMPVTVEIAGKTYVFQQWENGEVNSVRAVNLVAPTSIHAKYAVEAEPPPIPPDTPTWILPVAAIGITALAIYAVIKIVK